MTGVDKALSLLRTYPRVSLFNIRDLPRSIPPPYNGLKRKKRGLGHKGFSQFQTWPPLGTLIQKTPFYLSVPKEPYNEYDPSKRNMVRISLLQLQRLIDLNRIDPSEPIDLTTICNTNLFSLDTESDQQYGFHLTDEGADHFTTPVNIEVQYAGEQVIAAIEKAGGTITTRFYDLFSVWAKSNPAKFFKSGVPIPRAKLPAGSLIPYYANAESRGYLADPESVFQARIWLSQKYGYRLVNFCDQSESVQRLMTIRKDPRQIFYGLEPGCLVSITDKIVLKPKSNNLKEFYSS